MTNVTLTPPGDAERLRAPAGSYTVHLSGEQTGGALAIVEYTFPPGAVGAAPHVHRAHAEHFHILEGEIDFEVSGSTTTVGAGGTVSVPIGTAHGFRNASTAWARCLFLLTPAGYEDYFRDIHRALEAGETLTPDHLAALRSRYATDSL
ncbi:cupin domain-containing protein [Actinomadura rubrisoli]|uniref:Cupin domain-containing protein n=1 Tax=Actinomadura rubrisoli TaxID=2530368 RepID=A0A4R4ZZ40_9ACTN|nr:cupin domain-containing protein [Actinomadura rubrisoli]TDD63656.1 cupin domain-containing protein [Actinomadura rubrisoli]